MCNGDCNQGRKCDCRNDETELLTDPLLGLAGAACVLILLCLFVVSLMFLFF